MKHAPLPYCYEDCIITKEIVLEINLTTKKSLENAENYKRLKSIAQKTITKAANDYWKEFCGTLNRTSNLSAVWNMAKRMNGSETHSKT